MTYTIEQMIECNSNYEEICKIFFELAPNEIIKEKLRNILYNGESNGFVFNTYKSNMDNPQIEVQRRISMAYLLIRNQETYEFMEKNKINLFHGTNSNALSNILKYGVNSFSESNKNNIPVVTGEKSTRINRERDFVSFTDVLDIAEDYSTLSPTNAKENLSFPVIIGTTMEDVIKTGMCSVHSDTSEIGVKNKLPLENIRLIGVPSDKVEFVKKIFNNDKITIVAIDGIDKRFCYIEGYGDIIIIKDNLNELKNKLDRRENKIFTNNELKKLAKNLLLKKVKGIIQKINMINKKGEELNDDRPKHR